MKRATFRTLVLGGVSILGFADIAFAQEAAPAVEAVTVTGSRVINNGNEMPTPVTVVSKDDLANLKPLSMIESLNELPVFAGGRTQQQTGTPTGGTSGGAGAANQLSLRDLGTLRTLVLFDGQRVAPSSITNVVDADIVPQMLIQRVDVVTGGASAVYGSDAMVGVVNFIPVKDLDGIKVEGQIGESTYGDDQNYKAGIAGGTSFADGRGHIEASAENYFKAGIPFYFSRPWYNYPALTGAGTAANPLVLQTNIHSNQNTYGGLITSGVLAGQMFGTNGVLSPFVHGTATGTSTSEIGGSGSQGGVASLEAGVRWTQLYGRLDYDFSDKVHGHFQTSFKHMYTAQNVVDFANNNYTFSSTNAFLPAVYQAQLATAKQTTFKMSQLINEAPPWQADSYTNQTIVNAGLDGDLWGYKWSLNANFGQSLLADVIKNDENNQHMAASLDAVVNPANGQIVCSITLTLGDNSCVPFNAFGPTAASAAAIAYDFPSNRWTAKTKMADVNFSVSGQPFSTWAGPVGVALSAEWRRTAFSSFTSTDNSANTLADCTAIRFNCTQGTQLLWNNAFATRSLVGISVAEGAGEFDVPLLKDIPLVQSLSLNGAARFMSYSTSGDFSAWKIGAVWEVNDQLRVRGTASRDIRAPTINDIFEPASVMVTTVQDLLTNTNPTVKQFRVGNPALKPEVGRTNTVGAVYQPDWLKGASFTVDAFDITVSKAIVEVKISNSAQLACYASGGASPYCALQTRPNGFADTSPSNAITSLRQENINISSLRTYGADFEANYTNDLFGHRFNLRGYLTWQPHILNTTPGLTNLELAGVEQAANPNIPAPRWRLTTTESLNITDDFRVDVTERGRSALRVNGDTGLTATCCDVPALFYFDVNLSYMINGLDVAGYTVDQSEIFFNVNNLFDHDPPTRPVLGYDDVVGRSFVLGFRVRT
jgi:outer membrane receptor protein involved in Fe transport